VKIAGVFIIGKKSEDGTRETDEGEREIREKGLKVQG
jgi:hypothetical protein